MKIEKYKIVEGESNNFESRVREAIEEGWQPFGGVSIGIDRDMKNAYAQAMVMYNDKK